MPDLFVIIYVEHNVMADFRFLSTSLLKEAYKKDRWISVIRKLELEMH